MATLNQTVQGLADSINQTFNFALKERLKVVFKNLLAERLRNDIEKNGTSVGYSVKYNLPLELVDLSDDCALTVGCNILRSTSKIILPVRVKGRVPFEYVGDSSFQNTWTYVAVHDVKDWLAFKHIGKKILWDITNSYLYVFNNTKLKYAGVRGLYHKGEVLNCVADGTCYTDDTEMPIPEDMIEGIKYQIRKTELLMVEKNIEVKIDDSRE